MGVVREFVPYDNNVKPYTEIVYTLSARTLQVPLLTDPFVKKLIEQLLNHGSIRVLNHLYCEMGERSCKSHIMDLLRVISKSINTSAFR